MRSYDFRFRFDAEFRWGARGIVFGVGGSSKVKSANSPINSIKNVMLIEVVYIVDHVFVRKSDGEPVE